MVCKHTVFAKVRSVPYLYFFLPEGVTLKCYVSLTLKVLFVGVLAALCC